MRGSLWWREDGVPQKAERPWRVFPVEFQKESQAPNFPLKGP